MQWVWISRRLRLAERHLDRAVSSRAADVMQLHVQYAEGAYTAAMAAAEHVSLDGQQQRELDVRLQALSTRLKTLQRRSR